MKRMDLRVRAGKLWECVRARRGEIAYYSAVALALAAIAFAAEAYRGDRVHEDAAPSLPAAELAAEAHRNAGDESTGDADAEEEAGAPALPEGAELMRGYSSEPAWNPELGMWENHPAADYRVPGGEVGCLLSGTVRGVERGGARGGCVEVESGGRILRYASLEPRADLEPGDKLAAGEPVGRASDSMPGEAALGPHLHLEWTEGGAHVDVTARALPAGD